MTSPETMAGQADALINPPEGWINSTDIFDGIDEELAADLMVALAEQLDLGPHVIEIDYRLNGDSGLYFSPFLAAVFKRIFAHIAGTALPDTNDQKTIDSHQPKYQPLMGDKLRRMISADWKSLAACRGQDAADFFPEVGASIRQAKESCASCVVQGICLADALIREEKYGIYGGASERNRRLMRTMLREGFSVDEIVVATVSNDPAELKSRRIVARLDALREVSDNSQ